MRALAVVAAVASTTACGHGGARPPPDDVVAATEASASPPAAATVAAAPAADVVDLDCESLAFARAIPLAEASGAQWLPQAGGVVMVVSDSGNAGDYVVLDGTDGSVRGRGRLPLGRRGDDLEGLSTDGTLIWAITSSGWMRAWRPRGNPYQPTDPGDGFELAVPPYRIDDRADCELDDVNCGRNFEGLCLAAAGRGTAGRPEDTVDGCAGYAASKTSGELLCLIRVGDRYRLDPARAVATSSSGALADCAIGPDGAVWTGDNLFGGSKVQRRHGGAVARTLLGLGFPEAMAIAPAEPGSQIVYRFSDTGGSPSLAGRYHCQLKAGPVAPGE